MTLKQLTISALLSWFVLPTFAQDTQENPLKNELDSVSYGIGLNVAQNMKNTGFTEINAQLIAQAIDDVLKGNPALLEQGAIDEMIRGYMENMHRRKYEAIIQKGASFLAENKKRPSVVELPSGLQYEIIQKGTGKNPASTDQVTVHYEGTFLDGSVFDSSVARGQPATFPVNGVIPGWVEALQLMREGAKWRLYIPYNLAYGEAGTPAGIGPYETLIFEVELLSVDK